MSSQSFPPSSDSSVMIMSHRIDLAGLARRKNSLTLHETRIKVRKSPLPTPLVFTQNKSATHPRIGLGLGSLLTPTTTVAPWFFSGYTSLNKGDASTLTFPLTLHVNKILLILFKF